MATENTGVQIDADLYEDLSRWMAAQPVRPTVSAVIEEALRCLMAAHPVEDPRIPACQRAGGL